MDSQPSIRSSAFSCRPELAGPPQRILPDGLLEFDHFAAIGRPHRRSSISFGRVQKPGFISESAGLRPVKYSDRARSRRFAAIMKQARGKSARKLPGPRKEIRQHPMRHGRDSTSLPWRRRPLRSRTSNGPSGLSLISASAIERACLIASPASRPQTYRRLTYPLCCGPPSERAEQKSSGSLRMSIATLTGESSRASHEGERACEGSLAKACCRSAERRRLQSPGMIRGALIASLAKLETPSLPARKGLGLIRCCRRDKAECSADANSRPSGAPRRPAGSLLEDGNKL